jgi:hypothetical protein
MTIKRDPNRMEVPVHPGEVLLEEFLRPLGLSQATLARHLNVSLVRVNELARARRGEDPAGELMRVVADRKVRPPLRTGRHDVGFRASVGVPPCSGGGKDVGEPSHEPRGEVLIEQSFKPPGRTSGAARDPRRTLGRRECHRT